MHAGKVFFGAPGRLDSVQVLNKPECQLRLHLHRVQLPRLNPFLHPVDLGLRHLREKLIIAEQQRVGDRHDLSVNVLGRFGDADVVAERLAHLLHAVGPLEEGRGEDHLRLETVFTHDVPAYKEVELLVGPPQLEIRFQENGVVGLRQRIEKLVNPDGLAGLHPLRKFVPLQHARHRVAGTQTHPVCRRDGA